MSAQPATSAASNSAARLPLTSTTSKLNGYLPSHQSKSLPYMIDVRSTSNGVAPTASGELRSRMERDILRSSNEGTPELLDMDPMGPRSPGRMWQQQQPPLPPPRQQQADSSHSSRESSNVMGLRPSQSNIHMQLSSRQQRATSQQPRGVMQPIHIPLYTNYDQLPSVSTTNPQLSTPVHHHHHQQQHSVRLQPGNIQQQPTSNIHRNMLFVEEVHALRNNPADGKGHKSQGGFGQPPPNATPPSTESKPWTNGLTAQLNHLSLVSVLSLVLSVASLQVLHHLSQYYTTTTSSTLERLSQLRESQGIYIDTSVFEWLRLVALAVVSLSLTLDLICLLVCCMQLSYAVRLILLRRRADEEHSQHLVESLDFLKACSGYRLLAVFGFYISIPLLLTGVVLYMIDSYPVIPTVIMCGILGLGVLFLITAFAHTTYTCYTFSKDRDLVGREEKKRERRSSASRDGKESGEDEAKVYPRRRRKGKRDKRDGTSNNGYQDSPNRTKSPNTLIGTEVNNELSTLV